MGLEPIPSDPRTWTDWRDPESRGFVKIDLDTGVERVLKGVTVGAVIGAAAILWADIRAGETAFFLHRPERWAALLIAWACGIAAASYAAFALTDNFYLVDPARHVVYRHTKFGFVRRVRLWLERKDVLGVTTETRLQTRSTGSWRSGDFNQAEPHQRVVLISRLGRLVPFSKWKYDALWPSNNRAAELAKQLACAFYEAPDRCRLRVVVVNGAASVTFVPFKWWDRFEMSIVYFITSVAAAGLLAAIAYWFSRRY